MTKANNFGRIKGFFLRIVYDISEFPAAARPRITQVWVKGKKNSAYFETALLKLIKMCVKWVQSMMKLDGIKSEKNPLKTHIKS